MRRRLSTTTALVTGLALVFPTSIPLRAQDNSGQVRESEVCTEDMTRQECNRAERRAARREARGQAQADDQGDGQGDNQGFGQDSQEPAGQEPAGQEPAGQEPGQQEPAAGGFGGDGAASGDRGGQSPSLQDLEQQLGDGSEEQPQEEQPSAEEPRAEPEPQQTDADADADSDADSGPRRPRGRDAQAGDGTDGATGDGFGGDQSDAVTGDRPQRRPRDVQSLEDALGGQAGGDASGQEEPTAVGDGAAEGPSEAETEAATGAPEEWMAAEGEAEVVDEVTEQVTEESARSSSEEFGERRRPRDRDRDGDRDGDRAGDRGGRGGDRGDDDRDGGRGGDRDGDRAGRDRDDDDDSIPDFLRGAVVGAAGALIVGSLLSGDREVVSTTPDRVVVRDRYGNLQVLRDDDAILRQPGSEVTTRRFSDGSTETIVQQPDGSQVVTLRSAEGRVIKRVVIAQNGTRTVLFDDTVQYEPVVVSELPQVSRSTAPQVDPDNEEALRAALMQQSQVGRSFSLYQVRQIDRVRYLAPAVQVENITFETGSSAISPTQAQQLLALGELMSSMIAENPGEMFLIEGHTDAQGGAAMNLTLSDRRAESVALALTEYFGVSPANMVLQGYGESDLRVPTEAAERANRRVVVRRITPLLQVAQEG